MIGRTRDAGASRHESPITLLVTALALLATYPGAARAAEVRLLHADPGTVRAQFLPAVQGAGGLQLEVEADGRVHTLNLAANDSLGPLAGRLAGRAQAYAGKVGGYAGSWVAVTRIGTRWAGIWYDGGEYYGIDSAAALADAAPEAAAMAPDELVVYRLRDALWEDISLDGDTRAAPVSSAQLAADVTPALLPFGAGEPLRQLQIGIVADALLAGQDGAVVEENLLARLNVIDGLFTNQLGVRLSAGSVTIHARREDEPFSRTTNADHLLDEVSAWRHGDPQQRESGLTHLFTGRNLDGRTVGMAFMDALCSRRYSTSLSQATASVSFSALIGAHEIAHVFGAPHDGDAAGACAASPTDFLMAPRINGSQQFSQCSLEQMTRRVQAAACLAPVQTGWPAELPPPESGAGGGGASSAWMAALLALLAAARLRRPVQMRANQSDR